MAIPVLHDPMSRYGWGYGVRINNFFPQSYGCGGGCSGMEKMMGYMMMFNMLNQSINSIGNIFRKNDQPVQMPTYMPTNTFYPYVNFAGGFGGGGGTVDSNSPQAQTQTVKTLFELPEVKGKYKKAVRNNDGSYYLITKDNKTIKIDNFDELQAKLEECLGEEIEENDGKKPDNEPAADTPKPEAKVDTPQNGNAGKANTPSSNRNFSSRYVKADWVNYYSPEYNDVKLDLQKKKDAKEVINKLIEKIGYTNKDENSQAYADLVNDLIRKNPSIFDSNGNVKANVDTHKLDLPSDKTLREKYNLTGGTVYSNGNAANRQVQQGDITATVNENSNTGQWTITATYIDKTGTQKTIKATGNDYESAKSNIITKFNADKNKPDVNLIVNNN